MSTSTTANTNAATTLFPDIPADLRGLYLFTCVLLKEVKLDNIPTADLPLLKQAIIDERDAELKHVNANTEQIAFYETWQSVVQACLQ